MAIERNLRTDRRWRDYGDEDDEAAASSFKRLSREEAQALRAKEPPLSPWRVIGLQVGAGAVVALMAALVTGRQEAGWSALYGAAAVVVPGAFMVRGIVGVLGVSPVAAAVRFMFYEGVKILLTVVMLMAAARVVPRLDWPALLVGVATCLSMIWLALLWRGSVKSNEPSR